MKTSKILILTDTNRRLLKIILVNNILDIFQKIYVNTEYGSGQEATRIVYEESFPSEELANRRFKTLASYTRMQKEKLVRQKNPNWLNLYTIKPIQFLEMQTKKVVACA